MKTIKTIKERKDQDPLTLSCDILLYRPGLRNKQMQKWKKYKGKYEGFVHNYFNKGFEEGYQYAIERLQKHSQKENNPI